MEGGLSTISLSRMCTCKRVLLSMLVISHNASLLDTITPIALPLKGRLVTICLGCIDGGGEASKRFAAKN